MLFMLLRTAEYQNCQLGGQYFLAAVTLTV
jgi:hypothetical protein